MNVLTRRSVVCSMPMKAASAGNIVDTREIRSEEIIIAHANKVSWPAEDQTNNAVTLDAGVRSRLERRLRHTTSPCSSVCRQPSAFTMTIPNYKNDHPCGQDREGACALWPRLRE